MANEIQKTFDIIKNKYQEKGFDSLTDTEKFTLILSYSEKSNKIEKVVSKLSEIYGTLKMAMDSDPQFLVKDCGTNWQSALLLTLIPQLKRICELEKCRELPLDTVENAKRYFSAYLSAEHVEIIVATAVSKNFKVIDSKILSSGAVSEVVLSCREIVDFAMKNEGAYLFIAHNHPMGVCTPSADDISSTRNIKNALDLLGITLADHIIVGCGGETDLHSMRTQSKEIIFDDLPTYI